MINNYLEQQIKENFQYPPTFEQELAIHRFSSFLVSQQADTLFVVRGYAGTGKTSLVGAIVRTMESLGQKVVLLAPTGRAAKVFAAYAGQPAYTIHKRIYRQRQFSNDWNNFSLGDNLNSHTLFIVDEASMISNEGIGSAVFGSGRLLDDLIQYVYAGTGCRLMLMGDTAQLPPVGENDSPALQTGILKGYGLEVTEANLTEVVRQAEGSGILWNATRIRRLVEQEISDHLPKIRLSGFADIRIVPGDELIETFDQCYTQAGIGETIVICRSNQRANLYNKGIRASILSREDELNSGDLLMIAKNNYFWASADKEIDFIANGEIAEVRRVRRIRELYGFRFAEVLLSFPDYHGYDLEATVLLDTLASDSPALPKAENDRLFYNVLEDYAEIPSKRERMKKMKADPHYNALQIKYAYAVTGHKAQGGQWKKVFLDSGYLTKETITPDYFRWLYTAFTRATETLYLVNYPVSQTE